MTDTLYRLLRNGKTQFHVAEECEDILTGYGYRRLDMGSIWHIKPGDMCYVKPYPSMLVAFSAGDDLDSCRLSIGLAHTDFPMLKLKTSPDMEREGYMTLNVEPYGGLIKETWFDRPLGIAGKVVLETENPFSPRTMLYDSGKALCVIPSLAPHLKKDFSGDKMDVQKELIPVWGLLGEKVKERDILEYISQELHVHKDEILDYDLYLYNTDTPETIGVSGNMLASPRLDNITSVSALLCCMEKRSPDCINIIALFDNEEIGSRSKQGADSILLSQIIGRVMQGAGICEESRRRMMRDAFMLSLDVAHATHPNYPEKNDPTNKIILGEGVTLKSSASQRYVSDSEASAVVVALAKKAGIKLQRQANRSGMAGGQTLGPIASSYIPARAADMGVPVLAMHSARELCCLDDYIQLEKMCMAVFGV